MGFDRSKFGATSTDTLKKQDETQEELRPSNSNNGGFLRGDFHTLEAGDNTFRFYPFHPDGGGSAFYEPKTVSFLPIEKKKRDKDGKETDEVEVKRSPVFNAIVHGISRETGQPLKVDLVDTYLTLLKQVLEDEYQDDEDGFKKKWAIATRFKSDQSIKPQASWVAYADKFIPEKDGKGGDWKFGKLEFKSSIKDQLNAIPASLEGDDDVLNTDPYSDPDEGIPVVINKNPDEKPANYYKVDFLKETVKTSRGYSSTIAPLAISDEMLEKFVELPSLFEMFRNVYTEKDFKAQYEGLQRFDQKNGFGIIGLTEFEEAAEYLFDNVMPDKPEEEEENEKQEEKPKAKSNGIKNEPKVKTESQVTSISVEEEEEDYSEKEEQKEKLVSVEDKMSSFKNKFNRRG